MLCNGRTDFTNVKLYQADRVNAPAHAYWLGLSVILQVLVEVLMTLKSEQIDFVFVVCVRKKNQLLIDLELVDRDTR